MKNNLLAHLGAIGVFAAIAAFLCLPLYAPWACAPIIVLLLAALALAFVTIVYASAWNAWHEWLERRDRERAHEQYLHERERDAYPSMDDSICHD